MTPKPHDHGKLYDSPKRPHDIERLYDPKKPSDLEAL